MSIAGYEDRGGAVDPDNDQRHRQVFEDYYNNPIVDLLLLKL